MNEVGLLLGVGLFLCVLASPATGTCGTISVQDSEYEPNIDGVYNLYGYYCNNKNVWGKEVDNEGQAYYIAYYPNLITVNLVNDTVGDYTGWVIGYFQEHPCSSENQPILVLAINQQPASTEPYDLPDTWYELDSSNGKYYLNPNLQVNCTSIATTTTPYPYPPSSAPSGSTLSFLLLVLLLTVLIVIYGL